jgi:hypothetical protein
MWISKIKNNPPKNSNFFSGNEFLEKSYDQKLFGPLFNRGDKVVPGLGATNLLLLLLPVSDFLLTI